MIPRILPPHETEEVQPSAWARIIECQAAPTCRDSGVTFESRHELVSHTNPSIGRWQMTLLTRELTNQIHVLNAWRVMASVIEGSCSCIARLATSVTIVQEIPLGRVMVRKVVQSEGERGRPLS